MAAKLTAEEFVLAVEDAFERAGMPIVYIQNSEGDAIAMMIRPVAYAQLDVRGNVTEETKQSFWMRHSHIEPGMW